MKVIRITFLFSCLAISVFFLVSKAICQEVFSPGADCSDAKKQYLISEQKWSAVNAELRSLRDELENLHGLRWNSKITLSVLNDILMIEKDNGSLSPAQRITLNSRIPNDFGMINPDGSFVLKVLEAAPLKITEARERIKRLLAWAEEDINKTGADLQKKEQKSHNLSQKITNLEKEVEKKCKASNTPTLWEQGIPRLSGKEIYQRYVERERLRQEEVANRRDADIEKLWLDKYPHRGRFPYTGAGSRSMLIRLRNSSNNSILRCFPFRSSWDKRWILDELDKASQNHDHIPGLGKLGAFEVLNIFDDVSRCHERLF